LKREDETSRKLQAKQTKRRIFRSALSLIDHHGYNNVTIESISAKAGVSVGAFYHYYSSKSDILIELYAQIDRYYVETVTPHLSRSNTFDDIRIFFEYYSGYQITRGLDHVRHLISVQPTLFIDESRYMYSLFMEIIEQGRRDGVITKDCPPERIRDCYFVLARGVLLDWCLHEASYDIKEKMLEYTEMLKSIFEEKQKPPK
jgi:AcrR family transcriptional regulator